MTTQHPSEIPEWLDPAVYCPPGPVIPVPRRKPWRNIYPEHLDRFLQIVGLDYLPVCFQQFL